MQVVYNIFDQSPEDELFPDCREQDIAVIARVPFDEGSLTGTLTADIDVAGGGLPQHLLPAREPDATRSSASRRLRPVVPAGMTMPELALRHILQHPDGQHGDPGHAEAAARRSRTSAASDGHGCRRRSWLS